MDSKLWNLISALVLLLMFAVQWGTFSSRIAVVESTAEKNEKRLESIKDDLGEIKSMIRSHQAAHDGLQ